MRKPFILRSAAVYDDKALMQGLGVAELTLKKARRSGKLRSTRKGHRILYRGQWVIDWLEGRGGRKKVAAQDDRPLATPDQA